MTADLDVERRKIATGPRFDIQGLRAVAVVSVVLNHLTGQPLGGFVGVDVFFVVSGFLITGLLVREYESSSRINFGDFYRRRIRRIMPAAVSVLLATVFATFVIVSTERASEVGVDAAWALLFAANWRFAIQGTDYFTNTTVSPVQHYWSLSVEEQFYFIWPILIVLVMSIGWLRRRGRTALFLLMALICVVAFVYSLSHTVSDPTWAYFSTFDRVWELGAGALLAIARPALVNIGPVLGGLLGWLGFAVILSSFFVITDSHRFPAPWGLMPVLGTAMVLAGGVGNRQRHLLPLVNPLSRYVGDISYSMYLWHFPVIVIAIGPLEAGTGSYYLWCSAIIVTLSIASFHLIEEPVRHSMWLEPRSSRPVTAELARSVRVAGVGILACLVGGLWLATFVKFADATGSDVGQAPLALEIDPAEPENTLLMQQQSAVADALTAESFPTFSPAVADLGFDKWRDYMEENFCTDTSPIDVAECTFGASDAKKTAVVYGDSYAMALVPGMVSALTERGYKVSQLTLQQCPVWDVAVFRSDGAPYEDCDEFRDSALQTIQDLSPDLVVMTNTTAKVGDLQSRAAGEAAYAEVEAGLRSTLGELSSVKKAMIFAPPPITRSLDVCATRFAEPRDCEAEVSNEWKAVDSVQRKIASEFEVGYVDTSQWFCVNQRCPAFVGNTPVKTDGNHLTPEFAVILAPLMMDTIREFSRSSTQDEGEAR